MCTLTMFRLLVFTLVRFFFSTSFSFLFLQQEKEAKERKERMERIRKLREERYVKRIQSNLQSKFRLNFH